MCWDHSKALIYATDDIGSALRAGERWRADVRAATGKISIENTAAGEVVRIPEPEKEIVYRFESGEVRREISTLKNSQLLLQKVNTSQMRMEERARRDRVALGTGFERTQPGNPVAAALHLRGGANQAMKLFSKAESGRRKAENGLRPSERGMATVIFIALLAIMLVLVTVESRALIRLHREVKLMEQQQIKRLNGPQTNTAATTITQAK